MELDRRNPETWPVILSRNEVKTILGINANRVLEIFHRPDFPQISLGGKRLLVTKPGFLNWLEAQARTEKTGN
jgi:hypothetical protein